MEHLEFFEARKLAMFILEEIPIEEVIRFLNKNVEIIFEEDDGKISMLSDDSKEVKRIANIARNL